MTFSFFFHSGQRQTFRDDLPSQALLRYRPLCARKMSRSPKKQSAERHAAQVANCCVDMLLFCWEGGLLIPKSRIVARVFCLAAAQPADSVVTAHSVFSSLNVRFPDSSSRGKALILDVEHICEWKQGNSNRSIRGNLTESQCKTRAVAHELILEYTAACLHLCLTHPSKTQRGNTKRNYFIFPLSLKNIVLVLSCSGGDVDDRWINDPEQISPGKREDRKEIIN